MNTATPASPAVAELAKESLEEDISGPAAEIDALVAGEASGANNASAEPQCDERELARIETISGDPQLEEDKTDDGSGDCVGIAVSQVTPPHIRSQLLDFLNKLKTPGQYIGTSAFNLFTIAFGIQVNVSLKTEEKTICACCISIGTPVW